MGSDGAQPQVIIPQNTCFGAAHEENSSHGYTLAGCTVSTGFEFADFELASRSNLLKTYSDGCLEIKGWIHRLAADADNLPPSSVK